MLSTKINNVDNTGTYTLIKDRAHAALDKHTTIHRLTPTHPYLHSPIPAQSHTVLMYLELRLNTY